MTDLAILNPRFTPSQLAEKLKAAQLTPEQRKIFRALEEGGTTYGFGYRDMNRSGECLAFATMSRLEYETAVKAIVKLLPQNRRELAQELASLAYSEAYHQDTKSPATLKVLKPLLAA